MSQEKYIAAIEICSSKIIGAVGRVDAGGKLKVIAIEQEATVECVYHGVIQNVEETANRIAAVISRLEQRPAVAPRKIKSLYVGLAGRSLRNITREIARNLPEDTDITEELLESMRDEAMRANIDSSLEIIDAVPGRYLVNKIETKSPVGTAGSSLQATYQLLVARPQLQKHLRRVISDKVGLDIASIVITPLAVGKLILSADERRLGCMLVDLGAETTTVSIYRGGSLVYLAVLPIGSRNITLDITTLNMLEKDAEDMKTTIGNAIASDNISNLNINGVRQSDVSNLVVARAEEIVANILEQINYAGLDDSQLPGGIITIGGGFNLNRMDELLRRQSELNVRRGSLPSDVILEDIKAPSYETIEVISILSAGRAQDAPACLEIPHKETLPTDDTYTAEADSRQDESLRKGLNLREGRERKDGRQGGSRLLGKITNILSSIIPNKDDDDDDPDLDNI
ncbi:MAG: cell division protein FtsA [Muribaculaceae bacterium]|nr:cell division protein FtsA [Muribaculaceae bacterium]